MPDEPNLPLCLVDFVPNLVFLVGVYYLARAARLAAHPRAVRLVLAGGLLVFVGGGLKAGWKLLCAVGVPVAPALGDVQFVLMAVGFLMLLVGVVLWMRDEPPRSAVDSGQGLLAIALWKVPLLTVMMLSSLGTYGLLCYMAVRRASRIAGMLFGVAACALVAMARMAGGEQTIAQQWTEIGINTAGQIAFAAGSYGLYRSYGRRLEIPDA